MRRFGVLLSGCGVNDGSEIHEATMTLYHLDRMGVERVCFAPDAPQARVFDHLRGEDANEGRNMLVEAARIARGEIQPLSKADPDELNGLLIPGGFGAALNLCDYGLKGRDLTVREDVERLIMAIHEQKKPIGAICIAPVVVAKVLGSRSIPVELTIGGDPKVSSDIEAMGAVHAMHLVDEIHVDRAHKVVSTPAYMLGKNVAEIAPGIERLVDAVLSMA